MCQAKPGLRCANHLRSSMESLKEKITFVSDKVDGVLANADKETREDVGFQDAYNRENDGLYRLETELKTTTQQYNITETARNNLKDLIAHYEDTGNQRSAIQASETLAKVEKDYNNAVYMSKNQEAEMARMSQVVDDPNAVNHKFLSAAQERIKRTYRAIEDTPVVSPSGFNYKERETARMSALKELSETSSTFRATAGEVALQDPRYEQGLYGVFHAYDGTMYLSKAEGNRGPDGGIRFQNGETNTRSNEYDRNLVLVEKDEHGLTYSSKFKEDAKRDPSYAAQNMGRVSKVVLNKVPAEDRPVLASMGRIFQSVVEENKHESDEVIYERIMHRLPAINDQARNNRNALLEAYQYAKYSPRTDRMKSMALFESTEQYNLRTQNA